MLTSEKTVAIITMSHSMRHLIERGEHMKRNRLKAKMVENGMSVETVASAIGMERSKLYRKLNNFEKITIGDATKIKDVLNMTDQEAIDIFLT